MLIVEDSLEDLWKNDVVMFLVSINALIVMKNVKGLIISPHKRE